jgi:aspartyl-tRNA(Asn)/glutamyl-tRNA(Gln) amidotransferase subunit C
MSLTPEEVRHIAQLARVGVTPEDVERFREQLSNILENFEVLNQVDTDGVPPTGHAIPVHNVMREDTKELSYPREQVMANAPDQDDGSFRVRAVLEF